MSNNVFSKACTLVRDIAAQHSFEKTYGTVF